MKVIICVIVLIVVLLVIACGAGVTLGVIELIKLLF